MRSARRLVLVAMVSGVFVLQAGPAGAEKGGAAPKKGPGAVKRGAARAKETFQRRFGVRAELRTLKFGVGLKLKQGELVAPTAALKDPALIGQSHTYNFRERMTVNGLQGKVNRAWRKEGKRQLGRGVPEVFNQPQGGMPAPAAQAEPEAPPVDEKPVSTGQYL